MKLKTNKLLTLTLASSLVAITAGCGGGTKAAAPTGTTTTPPPADTVTYSDWSGSDDVTVAAVTTANAFLAGVAATTGTTATAATLANLPTGVTATTLNLASVVAVAVGTAPDITRTEETLGGDAADGVAFANNGDTTAANLRYFAGVVAGTDLGVPVPTTGASATWENGLFQAIGAAGTYATASKTFALTVTFGTTDAARTITALVSANTNADAFTAAGTSYYISGNYDENGVITGNVLYGDFSAAANDGAARTAAAGLLTTATGTAPTAPQTVGLGVLSGLIGVQGAVGGFHSSGSDGDGATGFAGGFVVSALPNAGGTNPNAVYADWSGSDDVTLVTATTANGFVAGDTAGLGIAALTANTVAINLNTVVLAATKGATGSPGTSGSPAGGVGGAGTAGVQLGGAATNGVAFAHNGDAGLRRYFAGLHNTTDLGAPLTSTTAEGTWAGLFQAIGNDAHATRKAFTLSVDFDTTTISAHIAAGTTAADTVFAADAMSYYLTGEFDAAGVVTGNIIFGDYSAGTDAATSLALAETALETATATGATGTATNGRGVLSGLIGATGAVGAFHSDGTDGTGLTGYAGGFVASKAVDTAPAATPGAAGAPYIVDYAKWDAAVTEATVITANGFLAGTATSIANVPQGVTAASVRDGSSTGAITGGASFFTNGTGTSQFYFAGIHNDTSLGAPVSTAVATADWSGMFESVSGTTALVTEEKAITLSVGFGGDGARIITGSVAAGVAASTTIDGMPAYHINGVYNTAGVISGFVAYNASAADSATGVGLAVSTATTGLGTLTGLIGASGRLAHSIATGSDGSGVATGYAGGFAVTRTRS